MAIMKKAPPKLKKKVILNKPVLNIPTNNTLTIDINKASLKEYIYITNIITVLAKPSFTPGIIPPTIGIVDSIILNTTDKAKSIDKLHILLISILLPTLLLHPNHS
jgi:hypothetical protein